MAQLQFDASTVAPQASFTPIPAGTYTVSIDDSEIKSTRMGGQMAVFRLRVVEGQHSGRTIYARINVRNPSQQAEQIGQAQLSALCHAAGVLQLSDTELPTLCCVLLGFLPAIHLKRPGKGIEVIRQPNKLFVKATAEGLHQLKRLIESNQSEKVIKELSTIESIEAVTPAYRRRGRVHAVGVLVATLADQSRYRAQPALEQGEDGVVFLWLGLVEAVGGNVELRVGLEGDHGPVLKLDLRIAVLLRFERIAGNDLRLDGEDPHRAVRPLDRQGSRKLGDGAVCKCAGRQQAGRIRADDPRDSGGSS